MSFFPEAVLPDLIKAVLKNGSKDGTNKVYTHIVGGEEHPSRVVKITAHTGSKKLTIQSGLNVSALDSMFTVSPVGLVNDIMPMVGREPSILKPDEMLALLIIVSRELNVITGEET